MEQARKARDPEQEGDLDEARVAAKAIAVVAGEVVLGQVRVDSVFVPTAVKKQPINWELPVMRRNVPSVESP
jgi:hypothetical protein